MRLILRGGWCEARRLRWMYLGIKDGKGVVYTGKVIRESRLNKVTACGMECVDLLDEIQPVSNRNPEVILHLMASALGVDIRYNVAKWYAKAIAPFTEHLEPEECRTTFEWWEPQPQAVMHPDDEARPVGWQPSNAFSEYMGKPVESESKPPTLPKVDAEFLVSLKEQGVKLTDYCEVIGYGFYRFDVNGWEFMVTTSKDVSCMTAKKANNLLLHPRSTVTQKEVIELIENVKKR